MKRHEYHFLKRARLTAILLPIGIGLAFLTPTIYNSIFPKQKENNEAYWLREGYSIRELYAQKESISADGTATAKAYRDSLKADSSLIKRDTKRKNLLDKMNPKAMK